MDDLLSEFLTETTESLSTLDVELVKLEQTPNDPEILQNIFRLVHTIKGTCGFLGLPRLETLAHSAENVLGKFRDGEIEVTQSAVSLILESLDRIKSILTYLEENEEEPEGEDRDLKDRLAAAEEGRLEEFEAGGGGGGAAESGGGGAAEAESGAEGEGAGGGAQGPVEDERGIPMAQELLDEVEQAYAEGKAGAEEEGGGEGADEGEGAAEGPVEDERGIPMAKELLEEVEQAYAEGRRAASEEELQAELQEESGGAEGGGESQAASQAPAQAGGEKKAEKKEEKGGPPAEKKEKKPAKDSGGGGGGGAGEAKESQVASQTIRVNVELLENLMTLVSELVLTRNQLLQMVRGQDDSEFAVPLQRLSNITTDLQEGVMKTRMQPIGNAWAKLPRIVRDLSAESGKKIDLQMHGAETELDRQVLESIKDPLTHMVRNSADHGLETPEERLQTGKAETGRIDLNAYHEGGHIIIEIKDDGRGLSSEKIKNKAIDSAVASEAEVEGMSEHALQQLIFRAGFSTADSVSSVSGRGVGMDVVRTNIENIGGTIELKSEVGRGTTFIIKIPLTLAIVSALVVEAAGERFAIPQISVLELVRVTRKSDTYIETINRAPVLRLRNRLLPLVSLAELLKLGETDYQEQDEIFVVVAQVGTFNFGIVVDRVFDTEEIVVKPVAPILRHIAIFSGNTIMGDGSVIMILDPNGIASETGEMAMGGGQRMEDQTEAHHDREGEKTSMLIFRAGDTELKAVPLALVARLEEIDVESIEHSHGSPVVQYRGHLMPLITIDPSYQLQEEGRQPILVFSDRDRSMGLVVDEIVDIVEAEMKVELTSDVPGFLGTAIIDGKSTDVIDAGHYLTQAFGDWFGSPEQAAYGEEEEANRVLLVDDSAFFRNLLTPLLSVSGYEVTSVSSAGEALRLRDDKERDFDAIVSDIEMPDMDGFEFARNVRSEGRWQEVPLIALSAHATERDFERGREVGFNDYVAKFDRDSLLQTLHHVLGQREQEQQGKAAAALPG